MDNRGDTSLAQSRAAVITAASPATPTQQRCAGPQLHNALLERKDVLLYQTEVLKEALDLVGRVRLNFTFQCDRVDVDFCPLLCDVDEKGRYILLAETAQRASLVGQRRKNLDPKKQHDIEIIFPSHAHRFAKGHRIALILASGNSPRYQPNPHNGEPLYRPKASLDAHIKILEGRMTFPSPGPPKSKFR